jgi:hypothetical protein
MFEELLSMSADEKCRRNDRQTQLMELLYGSQLLWKTDVTMTKLGSVGPVQLLWCDQLSDQAR